MRNGSLWSNVVFDKEVIFHGFDFENSELEQLRVTRLLFLSLLSRNFDDQLSSISHRFVILCICWDTLSEKTGLWHLPTVSTAFKQLYKIGNWLQHEGSLFFNKKKKQIDNSFKLLKRLSNYVRFFPPIMSQLPSHLLNVKWLKQKNSCIILSSFRRLGISFQTELKNRQISMSNCIQAWLRNIKDTRQVHLTISYHW